MFLIVMLLKCLHSQKKVKQGIIKAPADDLISSEGDQSVVKREDFILQNCGCVFKSYLAILDDSRHRICFGAEKLYECSVSLYNV
jgi:hypothetical protein